MGRSDKKRSILTISRISATEPLRGVSFEPKSPIFGAEVNSGQSSVEKSVGFREKRHDKMVQRLYRETIHYPLSSGEKRYFQRGCGRDFSKTTTREKKWFFSCFFGPFGPPGPGGSLGPEARHNTVWTPSQGGPKKALFGGLFGNGGFRASF